ncbi:hypothetical protein D0809_00810 [Flavobacterium circumlabens]|uniref:Uncharacterized protein n=1 Tax=Flavobacterium circumlabens TaxID=2133765 RepID=A0A4Y7UHB7_9FLAO|nr:hypothetical protein [Flavobacterium circumlabens]TCN52623.1 hypothetical protein EV142_110166 [Flavobacterium circumlabens]TEB45581.1 hypothetical protein D0809_00810 [Flavobacterium circumlabens]
MTNKKVILNLALPLSIITFILFTKWWIADVVDGTDGVMYGFPLIYKSPAFYTSMAEQYFIMELLIDFLFYFAFLSTILFLINIYISEIKIKRNLLRFIYVIAVLLLGVEILFATVFETSFSIKRDFDIKIKQTGFKFYFSNEERNEFNKLHQ